MSEQQNTSADSMGRLRESLRIPQSQYSKLPITEGSNDVRTSLSNILAKWKNRISRFQTISRMISSILNAIILAFMIFVIFIFLTTRREEASGRLIWPRDPKTWPTVLLLAIALLAMLVSVANVLYYCLCFKRAVISWKVIVVGYSTEIALFLVVTFLYRWEKDVSDLWGWSCSEIAAQFQARNETKVDFAKLCRIQEASWLFSLIETSLKIMSSFITYVIYMRMKKEVKAKQKLADGLGEGALGLLDVFV